jgi:hypothetical protein
MAIFRWGRQRARAELSPTPKADSSPLQFLRQLDQSVSGYLERVDRHELVYPACVRTQGETDCDIRAIWHHTRLEAVRYLTNIPDRDDALLIDSSRQLEILDLFLRRPPHEQIVIDFTASAPANVVIAVMAGLNWLNHCAGLAKVDRSDFSGTFRNCRNIVSLAKSWWSIEGAAERCARMLEAGERPPLMLNLLWMEYTRLAKKIVLATTYSPLLTQAAEVRSYGLSADQESELATVLNEVKAKMDRFEAIYDPDDLISAVP